MPIQITYHRNGTVDSRCRYVNGQRHGVSRLYFDNGVLASEQPYRHGRAVGIGRQWYRDGRLHGIFKDREANGASKILYFMYPNGRPEVYINRHTGEQRGWREDGSEIIPYDPF